jgi:thiamine biosynthesis protein ThiS
MMTTVMSELTITLNGDPRRVAAGSSVADLLASLDLPAEKVAVERNLAIVPRSTFAEVVLAEGDALEIVHFVGGGQDDGDTWEVAGRRFTSRLIVGTGKYKDYAQNAAAAEASGHGVHLLLHGGRVALQQRRDLRQAGVENEDPRLRDTDKGPRDAQEQLRVRLHRAAHIHQDEQARPLAAGLAPRGLERHAARAQAGAQGAAHIQTSAPGVIVPAARDAFAQALGDALGQLVELGEILREPLRQAAVVQGLGLAGAALGTCHARVL